MKRRVLKKQMNRLLTSEELPTTLKLSAMQELIKLSKRSSWFQFKNYPYVRFE